MHGIAKIVVVALVAFRDTQEVAGSIPVGSTTKIILIIQGVLYLLILCLEPGCILRRKMLVSDLAWATVPWTVGQLSLGAWTFDSSAAPPCKQGE